MFTQYRDLESSWIGANKYAKSLREDGLWMEIVPIDLLKFKTEHEIAPTQVLPFVMRVIKISVNQHALIELLGRLLPNSKWQGWRCWNLEGRKL